ncbi:UDP-glucuronosyltransferase 2B2-like [Aphis craccivora]|uniref:UDP-glucuronosyltransferase 2B2-like n=1 Tax=Aphis craccivora TaxID=307492 RepID=A0A6G0W2W7_APHCR|nr:UDP-glucuronosyltransferase 2B2-like [Aphis craccivora]
MYLPLFLILTYSFANSWIATPAEGARILAVETIGGKSHWNFMSAILRALVDRGHNVTVFTPFLDGNRENYTEFDTCLGSDKILAEPLNELMDKFGDPIKIIGVVSTMSRMLCNVVYENSKMKGIFSNTRSDDFDIVLIEPLFSECVSYLAVKLNLPLIYVLPIPTMGVMERYFTGDMSNPAVVSINMAHFGIPKTFVQRAINSAYLIYCSAILRMHELRDRLFEPKEYDLHAPIAPSLIFVNRHFTIEPASPIQSNVVEIGGIHLKAPRKLPKVRTIIKYT